MAVDLTTGGCSILSDNSSTPNADNPFSSPDSVVLDSANNRALVTDSRLDALMAVDLINGQRVFVSR